MNSFFMKLSKNHIIEKVLSIITLAIALSLLLKRDICCLITLVVSCVIITYFTKNITFVLLGGLVVTLMCCNLCHNVVENFEKNEDEKDENEKDEEKDEEDEKEEMTNLHPASLNDKSMEVSNKIDKVGKLDHAASVEAAYDNLDKILSSSALQNMSQDTARLAEKQENLMKQLKNFEPMMKQADGMLKSLGNFDLNNLFKKDDK